VLLRAAVCNKQKMKGAVLVAIAASIGNFLQGWDNATIAGILYYIILYSFSSSFVILLCLFLIILLD